MSKENYIFLKKQFAAYETVYSKTNDCVEIINPFSKDNIMVEYIPEDEFTPYLCQFSFQHRHFKSEKEVIDYINDIMNQNVYAIEFFKDGEKRFGGDITVQELNELSYVFLEQRTGYYGEIKLKDIADSFKIRGWNPCNNLDVTLHCDKSGNISLVKTMPK